MRKRNRDYNYEDVKKSFMRDLECSNGCGRIERVSSEAISVICWMCANKMTDPPIIKQKNSETESKSINKFPRGWHLKKQFVDKEKNVYEFGKENPKLKGKFKPTPIVQYKKKEKKSLFQKNQEEQKLIEELAQEHKEKEKHK